MCHGFMNAFTLAFEFLNSVVTAAANIYGLKSIAAYRSGLNINPAVSISEAEEGLRCTLCGKHDLNVSFLMIYGLRCLSISWYSWIACAHFKQKPH